MDIMRLLTRKLKSQSLEEVDEEEAESRGRRTFSEGNSDTMQATEFDSGTASDEDVTEFEEEEPYLHGVEAKLNCQVVQMSQMQMDRAMAGCLSSQPIATSYSSSLISSPQHFTSVITPASKDSGLFSNGQTAAAATLSSGRLSAVSSDFEWCSVDSEPLSSSSCFSEMDQHSSEEELVSIYRHEQKRKHSQVSRDDQRTSGEEEDEEELDAERFPRDCDHRRPLSSLPSNHRCLRGNNGIPLSAGQTTESEFMSPRKRHRQHQTNVNSTAVQQRPSLNLYKMQKTSITRKYGCSNSNSSIASTKCRPRVVKIRTINGSSRPAKSVYNPSVFCFRSISWASSRLKEEPFRAF